MKRRDGGARWGRLLCACWLITQISAANAAEAPKATAERLGGQLASPEKEVRREAIYQLGKLGLEAKVALPALLTAIDDNDKQVWTGALELIAALGPEATEAVPVLIQALDPGKAKGGRERDRAQAQLRLTVALARIGPAALPALIAALSDEAASRRSGAARALGEMGSAAKEAVPALVANLAHGDEAVRQETVEALGLLGAPAVSSLIGALGSNEEAVRRGAALALGQIGYSAAEGVPALASLLEHEEKPSVRVAALSALPRLSSPSDATLTLLIIGLQSDDTDVRHAATNGLLSSRAVMQKAVPSLSQELRSAELPRRQRAAQVLGRMGTPAAPAIPLLLQCAQREPQENAYTDALAQIGAPAMAPLVDQLAQGSETPGQRDWIFRALRGMGAPALVALTPILQSPTASVRAGAALALSDMGIDSAPTNKALLTLTDDKDAAVRAAALRAVSNIRSLRQVALPKLETALQDPDLMVRQSAAAGLARLGEVGKLGADGLIGLMNDPEVATQRNAIQALPGLGAGAVKAVPVLLLKVEEPALRVASIDALGKLGEPAQPAVKRLVELADTDPDEVRFASLQALYGIGTPAQPALPVFYKNLQHENRDIRIQALKALLKIEPSDDVLLPVTLKVFSESIGSLHRAAASGLKRFGDKAQPAVPALLDMLTRENDRGDALITLEAMRVHAVPALISKLDDKAPQIRVFACQALAKLGAEAQPAVPALQHRAEADPEPVKSAARTALEQISKGGG